MNKDNGKILQAGTVLFVLNVLASALNYLCQLVLARVLSVESYGTVNTIFSFMMIIAVPGTTLTMIVAKYFADSSHSCTRKRYLNRQLKVVMTLTVLVIVVLASTYKLFSRLLAIDDKYVLVLAFLLAAWGYFQPLYSGVFSGDKQFILVGIYSMAIPIYKLLAVLVAYIYTRDDKIRLYIILFVMFVGVLATAAWGQKSSNKIIGNGDETSDKCERLYSEDDFNALFLNISLMIYMNIDLLSVRYYGNDSESGYYSSVLLFGRIVYYFATTLGTILLPSVADNELTPLEKRKSLNKSIVLMIVFAGSCMIPINVLKEFLISVLYGEAYLSASKYVGLVGIISLALSMYTIMVNYVVGVGKTKYATVIMLIIDLMLFVAVVFIHNIWNILMSISIIGVAGAFALYVGEMINSKKLANDCKYGIQ